MHAVQALRRCHDPMLTLAQNRHVPPNLQSEELTKLNKTQELNTNYTVHR